MCFLADFVDIPLGMTPNSDIEIDLVNISSADGLLPNGTKPSSESTWTKQQKGLNIHLRAISQETLKIYIF